MAILLNEGANVLSADVNGTTPLMMAAYAGHLNCVSKLLEAAETDSVLQKLLDLTDHRQATALHFAAFRGHDEILKLLVTRGSKVDLRDIEGSTALHKAAFAGHKNCVAILVANKADTNARDNYVRRRLRATRAFPPIVLIHLFAL